MEINTARHTYVISMLLETGMGHPRPLRHTTATRESKTGADTAQSDVSAYTG